MSLSSNDQNFQILKLRLGQEVVMFVCVTIEITGSSVSEVLVNFEKTWNVTLVTRVIVDQQLWISMNSWNTKLYVFNAHSVALIFQCWQCSSNFSTAATLSFHMKTVHEGQNIQCNICDSLKGSLEAPLRSKHEELKLKCQMCHGNKFTFTINANTQMFAAGN